MYTWPDVKTFYTALFLEDSWALNDRSSLKFSGSLARHFNEVASELGLESLQIFLSGMKDSQSRILKSISSNYLFDENGFSYGFGLAYGERALRFRKAMGFICSIVLTNTITLENQNWTTKILSKEVFPLATKPKNGVQKCRLPIFIFPIILLENQTRLWYQ